MLLGFATTPSHPQKPYAAPDGRLWLAFRWGDNTGDDHSYFYTAQPGNDDAWSYLRNDLPRNIQLWGAGDEPLISNASAEEPFEVFRVHYE